MLYGIIADIHSNVEALDAVLSNLGGVDKVFCLGDVVGYGADPNECTEKVRSHGILTVAGNHDKAVVGEMEMTWFNKNAREAIYWTQNNLTPENLEYLKRLPLTLAEGNAQFVHGSLRNPLEEYISSIGDALPTFALMDGEICFTGHTHIPFFIALKKDGNYEGRRISEGEEIVVDRYRKIIINVGAVGQPRDGDPRASFGAYNSRVKLFSLHKIPYDVETAQVKMKKAGLPLPLIERLKYGH